MNDEYGIPHLPPEAYSERERRLRFAYLELTEADLRCLRDLAERLDPHMAEIAEHFYRHLLSLRETREVFRDAAMIERLKQAQMEYLRDTLRGPYDEAYFQRRWRIGYIHNAIHLAPHWFIGGFQLYRRILYPMLQQMYGGDTGYLVACQLALDKVLNLDAQLGIESYMAHYVATMESIQKAARRIEQDSAAKSRFLANMSHEFRTPLNAILGFAEVLEDSIAGPLNEEQMEYVREIHSAGEMLLRLVTDLLDLSKVEAGRLELVYETFAIAPVIRETITVLRGAAERRGLTLRNEVAPDIGFITADPFRFKQVLVNLLSNAIKFTDRGGIAVQAAVEGERLRLQVEDSGIGVAPEDRERIFDEFGQLAAAGPRRQGGTGLGLALARELVEAHGGRIRVKEAVPHGSVFEVELPLKPAHSHARETSDGG